MGTSRAADKGEAGCPLKKLFPAGVGVGAGAGWKWNLGCRAGQSLENTPFSDPGAGLFSPEWCVQGGSRGLSRPGTWVGRARVQPRSLSVHPSRAPCEGEKEGVKS